MPCNKLNHYHSWNLAFRKKRSTCKEKRGQIPDIALIDEHPKVVEQRKRSGDLEADLVIVKGHKMAILTIVNRATKMLYTSLLKKQRSRSSKQRNDLPA